MDKLIKAGGVVRAVLPAAAGLVAIVSMFAMLSTGNDTPAWRLAYLTVAVILGFGVVALTRYALLPLQNAAPPAPGAAGMSEQERVRSRLAPLIVSIGTLGITVLAVSMMALLVYLAHGERHQQVSDKIDTLLNGVFTATLPVLATWVGTVLAFYFTNESFRQAAESTRETLAATMVQTVVGKLWGTPRVVEYEKITRKELDQDVATSEAAEQAAARLKLKEFDDIFRTSATASRIIVFDRKRRPIFIIRKRRMPAAVAEGDTLDAYLAQDDNRADAKVFRFLGVGATLTDARSIVERYRVLDIFLTETGKPDEPVKGWTTDDLVRSSD
jgi:hypothetical protein